MLINCYLHQLFVLLKVTMCMSITNNSTVMYCILLQTIINRFVSVMVTTQAMIAAGANLVTMDQTVANHKFSLDGQLLLTLMKSGKNSLTLFRCCVHKILITLLFWKNQFLETQALK